MDLLRIYRKSIAGDAPGVWRKTDFIPLADGQTRINVKINAGQETEINGQGPKITETAIQKLFEKLKSLKAGDVLVLAGSIPSTLPENIYEWILMCLRDKDVKVVVDATKDLLLNVLKYHPFLIKPNNHELGEMFQTTLTTEEEIIAHAKKLQERGARNVLVSMAKDGAILVTEDGEIYKKQPQKGTVVNSVGAGDSMVAGFLAGYLNTGSYERALELGTAAGSATAFQSWLASREDIVNCWTDRTANIQQFERGRKGMKITDLLKRESVELSGTPESKDKPLIRW